ncbi:unnamed protein product [Echinostoma caproni]|uniref:Secreted protein n=1 Tax=Echinostoma caproni TaxID=27848 RepID=A0A183ARP8_9TREM|nr:unnamed protein product [Echinostoma caproni]
MQPVILLRRLHQTPAVVVMEHVNDKVVADPEDSVDVAVAVAVVSDQIKMIHALLKMVKRTILPKQMVLLRTAKVDLLTKVVRKAIRQIVQSLASDVVHSVEEFVIVAHQQKAKLLLANHKVMVGRLRAKHKVMCTLGICEIKGGLSDVPSVFEAGVSVM